MNPPTLGQRLKAAMEACGKNAASVADDAGTTEATVSNWFNDSVRPDNVKAAMLFAIADAVREDPRYLLTGVRDKRPGAGSGNVVTLADRAEAASHSVQLEDWKIAFQLVAEALGTELTLPPDKQAEVTMLTLELLSEGMPRAKVLRFVRAAAA